MFFIASRTIFTLFKDKFTLNEATEGSTVYMIDTSSETSFSITGCTFAENVAEHSTIVMIKSYGAIERSQFIDNEATSYSQNIFMSMSTISISYCSFSD